MITSPLWSGQTYGVYGLARTGTSVAAALTASGARVAAWDDGEAARAAFGGELTDLHAADMSALAAMVVSPGVPHDAAVFQRAVAARIPVIGDIELFAQARAGLPPHRVVGVTGTNGKSTTAALIHHILVNAGTPARLGGNIGAPILSEEPLPAGGVYVLELSSFQLDLTFSLDCDVAVLLNVTPDHLDRYAGFEAYAAAKARLFEMQESGAAIISLASLASEAVWRRLRNQRGRVRDVSAFDVPFDPDEYEEAREWPSLKGTHNRENAAAAKAVCEELGVGHAQIAAALATYPGLPHRMERVATVNGVAYVNDSKATNPTSAAPALAAFPHIHWIAGGLPKTAELDACLPHLGYVRAAYLIGDAAPLFAGLLHGKVPVVVAGTLDRAVTYAASAAQPGDTVLLSPACASYDQFADYAARGAAFKSLVGAL